MNITFNTETFRDDYTFKNSPEAIRGLELAYIIGPIFLTFTLTKWSGKPLLERGLKKSRPGYAEYVARTSGFFPLPPKKG